MAARMSTTTVDGSITIEKITKVGGIAGQTQYSVRYLRTGYEWNERGSITLTGSVYGAPGPVVYSDPHGHQTFVSSPERFGSTFGRDWCRRFALGETV